MLKIAKPVKYVSVSLLVVPVLIDLFINKTKVILKYFAPDAFFYLNIGKNISTLGRYTYDQETPTNGFHPLWQMFCGYLYDLNRFIKGDDETYFLVIFYCSLILMLASLLFIIKTFEENRGKLQIEFLLVPLGLYTLSTAPIWIYYRFFNEVYNISEGALPIFGTMWSFLNGQASPLVFFSFGIFFYFYNKFELFSLKENAILGGLAALLVLSRLDILLVLLPFCFYATFEMIHGEKSIKNWIIFGSCWAGPIVIYLLINLNYADSLLPVSGKLKSTFPTANYNNFRIIKRLILSPFGWHTWQDYFYRIFQILIPSLFAAIYLTFTLKDKFSRKMSFFIYLKSVDKIRRFLILLAFGIINISIYDFLFVKLNHTGHWYFPLSMIGVSLMSLDILQKYKAFSRSYQKTKFFVYTFLSILIFTTLHKSGTYHNRFEQFFYSEGSKIKSFYNERGITPKLVSIDDGIVAYSTGFKTMSGHGHVLDKKAFEELLKGKLFKISFERGFDRVTSLIYPGEVKKFLPKESGYSLAEEYRSNDIDFVIYKIIKNE